MVKGKLQGCSLSHPSPTSITGHSTSSRSCDGNTATQPFHLTGKWLRPYSVQEQLSSKLLDCTTRSWTISFCCCCCCCLRHPFNSSSVQLQVSEITLILSSFQNRKIVWKREYYPERGSSLIPEKTAV